MMRKMFIRKKSPSSSNRSRTYDLLVSSPDALPLSYIRLVGAKAIKLGSYAGAFLPIREIRKCVPEFLALDMIFQRL